ncbi:glucose dehydrogenase [Arthrobacter psychrolactophilus]|uniref:Glucose dehydrogenase n=1 Tax=Arthrobacter psychrolactophilus TaxID=92442 RepID=A0A2V5JL92_9MICC|nr:PQQ-dependent sugar dehydrogenase [Arthrobacter psychrolactophilus]PYI38506.1 glucose dehydrogenase [Arthrobacter psychrolactophilus]
MSRDGRWRTTVALVGLGVMLSACQASTPDPISSPLPTQDLATNLEAPWSLIPLADDSLLLSERDSGQIVEVSPSGIDHQVGEVPGAVHQGEGGLLGLATRRGGCSEHPTPDPATGCLSVYAYLSTAEDNRVVRMPLLGESGARTLGRASAIITGIPRGSNHNGGRIAFGPDSMLYIGTGDAGDRGNAQDTASLGGKILRMTPEGEVPPSNPFPNSYVWSLGHRNVQGLAWDASGRLWASEFGQNTWDELNQIQPGHNYGWPLMEGKDADTDAAAGFTNPVLTWPTSEASPSGIAIAGTTLYMASLRGERLWHVELSDTPSAEASLVGQLGRLRDVALTPNGRLLVLTNNTDGRGSPKPGDDRVVEITR